MTTENARPASRADVNTELLYTDDEVAAARRMYDERHPSGPAWQQAEVAVRGPLLEEAGRQATVRAVSPLIEVPGEMRDIVQALHDHRRDHIVRFGERPEVLVLVGNRLWRQLVRGATRNIAVGIHPDPFAGEMVVPAYGARIVPAGIPLDEWRLVVATEWRGTVGS